MITPTEQSFTQGNQIVGKFAPLQPTLIRGQLIPSWRLLVIQFTALLNGYVVQYFVFFFGEERVGGLGLRFGFVCLFFLGSIKSRGTVAL